jgi:hypothetical protein
LHGRKTIPLGPLTANQLFRLNHGKIITGPRVKSKRDATMANVPPLERAVLVLMGFSIFKSQSHRPDNKKINTNIKKTARIKPSSVATTLVKELKPASKLDHLRLKSGGSSWFRLRTDEGHEYPATFSTSSLFQTDIKTEASIQ